MSSLATHYDPAAVEDGLDAAWEAAGHYQAQPASGRPPYVISIPPPNVTGSLHMGHALMLTLQDVLIRYKRMAGYDALWVPGTDHAGIATQMVVERELQAEGTSRFDLGRDGFLERAFDWKERYHARITMQMRKMGVSVDWSRERFTLDDDYCRAVRTVFVRLFHKGLIYQDHRLVNWSPGIRTVLSDLEIDHLDVDGHLWHLVYPLVGDDGRTVTVATTRPETMLGDTAVAVHPDDPRHADLIGREVALPLTGRTIPIVGDPEAVDLEFGTGAVKITPAHDFNDFETGKRHDLPMISIFDEAARCNDECPAAYRGLDRAAARERVVADLEAAGLLAGVEPHKMSVGHCQRTGAVVEPMLSTQWFVRIQPLADPAIEAVRSGAIKMVPDTWEKTYFNWMENIRDWCISRQLWWGHRIPVWTCRDCAGLTCVEEDPSACAHCGSEALDQDEDVLDTWFSSGLWPFAILGWPDETPDLARYYPNQVMETGFDIIFFWVARMIMMGIEFQGEIPFSEVYLHPMVRDKAGQKMSKTKGNVVDPLEVIPEHGADALRFTLATLTTQGRDIKLSLDRVAGYRSFCNKLWNATRFVLMNVEDLDEAGFQAGLADGGGTAERWIAARLDDAIDRCDAALAEYRFNDASSGLYQFTWHTFCDWYVELAKQPLRAEAGSPARRAAQATALQILEHILRLLHPFMPHVTERLWQALPAWCRPADAPMLIVAPWPRPAGAADPTADAAQEHVNEVISAIRNIRSERGVPPRVRPTVVASCADDALRAALTEGREHIVSLCRLADLAVDGAVDGEPAEGASVALVGGTRVAVSVPIDEAGLAEERARLTKAIAKAEADLAYLDKKLQNPKFVDRAPAAVVAKERDKRARAAEELDLYRARLTELG